MAQVDHYDLYCRLYIDTHETDLAIQAMLNRLAATEFGELRVWATNYKNDCYLPELTRRKPYDPIASSLWTAEIDAEKCDRESFAVFQAGIVAMILELRTENLIVTASCDFEDYIAIETGWNWSEETPDPLRI